MKYFAIILFGLIATSFGDDESESSTLYDADSNEASIEERIIGGNLVSDLKKFNYQVGIMSVVSERYGSPYEWQNCGGVLIHTEVVLTAAHCVYQKPLWVAVFYGTRIKPNSPTAVGNIRVEAENVIAHPEFNMNILSPNDIAVINLPFAIRTGDYINTIKLASYDFTNCDGEGIASGWGYLDDYKTGTSNLMSVKVSTMSFETCSAYTTVHYQKQICLNGVENNQYAGTCQGDSGGPYVETLSSGELCLCGITSFGTGKCQSGRPNVFTAVAYFNDNNWICDNTHQKVGCNKKVNNNYGNNNIDVDNRFGNGYYYQPPRIHFYWG